MAPSKSSAWSRRKLVPALIGFAMLYQLVYNIMLYHAVQRDIQEECSASAGTVNDSPRCLEYRIFRDWHEAELSEPGDDADLLHVSSKAAETHAASPITVLISNHTTHMGEILEEHERKMAELRKQREIRAQKRQALMDQLEQKIRTDMNSSSIMTPWAEQLMTLQGQLESEMHEHERRAKMASLERAVRDHLNADPVTPWAKDLATLQGHLEEELKDHATLHTAVEKRHVEHVARREKLANEITERMTKLESHLADVASKRKTWEANLVMQYGVPESTTTTAPKSFLEKRLQWSPVKAWTKSPWQMTSGTTTTVVFRKELRHMHWSGAIPSVACITAIEGTRHAKARMMYFINNFRLQDYEGQRTLILVYHYSDEDAKELVQTYADGSYIKGVAVHGKEAFPSTTALRYGAWKTEADVIARWDFDEWHDPSRLSMQIRALAMVARPACIIRHVLDSNTTAKSSGEASILGERSWMEDHWHPFLEIEHEVLQASQASNVVELDMQNDRLVSNISHIDQVFDRDSEQEPTDADSSLEPHGWNLTECLEFDDSNNSIADERNIESSISENIGPVTGNHFHTLMTRRHDVTQKLQLLCLESVLEDDVKKKAFMRQHVDQMVNIRAELDKHIADMRVLFEDSSDDP